MVLESASKRLSSVTIRHIASPSPFKCGRSSRDESPWRKSKEKDDVYKKICIEEQLANMLVKLVDWT